MPQTNPFENINNIAQQMATRNNLNPAQNSAKKSAFEEQLMALAMANKIPANTQWGFLLGQILGGGLKDWKERYDDRGYIKDRLMTTTPEERQKMLENLRQTDPQKYERIQKRLAKQGTDAGTTPQLAQPNLDGINQAATSRLANQAVPQASPELLSGGGNSALDRAVENEAANQPVADSPFGNYTWNNDLDSQEKILEALVTKQRRDWENQMLNSRGWR